MNTTNIFNRAAANDVLKRFAASPHTRGFGEAVWLRDLLLLAWLFHHPERMAELLHITCNEENTGHLFKDDEGDWKYHNVNAGHAMQLSMYVIAQPVACLIEPYLRVRKLLLKKETDSLFHMPFWRMQNRLNALFEEYFGRAVSFSELREMDAVT